MINSIKSIFKRGQPRKDKRSSCEHPGVSMSMDYDKPSYMQCHFCDRFLIRYDTEIPLFSGSNHTKIKKLWIEPHPELEVALKTSPREYGDLKVEKFLRRKGHI